MTIGTAHRAALATGLALLVVAAPAPSQAGDEAGGSAAAPDALVACTVRIEHGGAERDGMDFGPSIEEASDLALETACAQLCVPNADDPEDPTEEDADALEACIEACANEAVILGTMCTDASEQTVFADGAFASDSDADGAPAPDDPDPAP